MENYMNFIFVKYYLYGMEKAILLRSRWEFTDWCNAMNTLNYEDKVNFKIISANEEE